MAKRTSTAPRKAPPKPKKPAPPKPHPSNLGGIERWWSGWRVTIATDAGPRRWTYQTKRQAEQARADHALGQAGRVK